jgi:hypothetical protein
MYACMYVCMYAYDEKIASVLAENSSLMTVPTRKFHLYVRMYVDRYIDSECAENYNVMSVCVCMYACMYIANVSAAKTDAMSPPVTSVRHKPILVSIVSMSTNPHANRIVTVHVCIR